MIESILSKYQYLTIIIYLKVLLHTQDRGKKCTQSFYIGCIIPGQLISNVSYNFTALQGHSKRVHPQNYSLLCNIIPSITAYRSTVPIAIYPFISIIKRVYNYNINYNHYSLNTQIFFSPIKKKNSFLRTNMLDSVQNYFFIFIKCTSHTKYIPCKILRIIYSIFSIVHYYQSYSFAHKIYFINY